MLIDREIKILQLEPTNVCQAECPMCARETNQQFDKKLQHHLTMSQILQVIDYDDISRLDKMFMCGVYGDPAAGRNTLSIFENFRKINSDITLGMNSNGALQNTQWWSKLADILNQKNDYVVFSIDGLEDTNHIYRKNVVWRNLVNNAKAFIAAGGNAHWDMLVFKHNEHQISQCESLAKDLGFKWFRTKVSRRGFNDSIQSPINWFNTKIKSDKISCMALNEKSLYINAQGDKYPCCWVGADFNNKNIDFSVVQQQWSTSPLPVCQEICGSINNLNNFNSQWQKVVEIND